MKLKKGKATEWKGVQRHFLGDGNVLYFDGVMVQGNGISGSSPRM